MRQPDGMYETPTLTPAIWLQDVSSDVRYIATWQSRVVLESLLRLSFGLHCTLASGGEGGVWPDPLSRAERARASGRSPREPNERELTEASGRVPEPRDETDQTTTHTTT